VSDAETSHSARSLAALRTAIGGAAGELLQTCLELQRIGGVDSRLQEFRDDLGQIVKSAERTVAMVASTLDDRLVAQLAGELGPVAAARKLRHDLTTPIAAVKGYADLILEESEGAHPAEFDAALRSCLVRVEELMAELRLLTRV